MIEGESHCMMHKADNPTWWKARPHWTERDLHNGRRVGQTNLPVMWSCHDSLKAVTQAQNSGIKMANHKRL